MISVDFIMNALEHCEVRLPFFDTPCIIVSCNLGDFIISLNESPVNALNPYNAMKLYVYIFKRLNLKRFEIFKNIPSNCRPQFSDLWFCMYCIHCFYLCQFLYICLTSETLHYPWIPSSCYNNFFGNMKI